MCSGWCSRDIKAVDDGVPPVSVTASALCPVACRAHKLACEQYVQVLKARVQRDVTMFRGKFNQYDVFK